MDVGPKCRVHGHPRLFKTGSSKKSYTGRLYFVDMHVNVLVQNAQHTN